MGIVSLVFGILAVLLIGACGAAAYLIAPKRKCQWTHERKVKYVRGQVLRRARSMEAAQADGASAEAPGLICTNRKAKESVTTRATSVYKSNAFLVDCEVLDSVININTSAKTVHVEPRVSVGELTDILVPMGFSIPVVPELRQLTVGGLLVGAGLETSSHKYGLIKDFCSAYEILLGDGTVKWVTLENDPELFHLIPFSYGTSFLLLSCVLEIIPVKPYVRLDYIPTSSNEEAIEKFTELSCAPEATAHDFVEGLLYSREAGIVIGGTMVDEDEIDTGAVFSQRWHWCEWYYKHAQKFLGVGGTEYMRLGEYYHRHDRGVFWTMEMKFKLAPTFIMRLLFGWALDRRFRLLFPDRKSATTMKKEKKRTVQDAVIPLDDALEGLVFFEDLFEVFPIWLCPLKIRHELNTPDMLLTFPRKHDYYIDIGVYGNPQAEDYDPVKTHRAMEKFIRDHDGFVGSYAVCYSTEGEFWETYNKASYDRLRSVTNAEGNFVDILDKISGKHVLKMLGGPAVDEAETTAAAEGR